VGVDLAAAFRFRETFTGAFDLVAIDPAVRKAVLRRFVPLFESMHTPVAAALALDASGMTKPLPGAIFVAHNNRAGLAGFGLAIPGVPASAFLGACCLRNALQIDIDVF
jgi:hypothetical protein